MLPYSDVVMYNASVPINEETIRKAKEAKVELWYQNIGVTRYHEGFYLWRTGAKGRRQFYVNGTISDPTAHYPLGLMYFDKKRMFVSLSLEKGREGVDDLKYVYTLETLINSAKKDKIAAEEVKKAEAVLKEIFNKLSVDPSEGSSHVYEDGSLSDFTVTNAEKYDSYRLKIAECIIKLNQAMKR